MPELNCHHVDPTPGALCNADHSSYGFQPLLWTGILFCCLFGVEVLIHLGLLAYHKVFPRFMFICVIGGLGEFGGWVARTYGHVDPFNRNAYIAQTICLILSPAFISAVNYVAFQHTMDVFGSKWSRIPRKWYVLGFCAGDISSLVVQAVGGALSAEAVTEPQVEVGKNVMIAGVTLQVAVTAPFLMLFFDYTIRRLRDWKKAGIPKSERPYPKVELFTAIIGVSTTFVLIRCIYRIVEMANGWVGYLATHEVYFDTLDGLMITIAIGVFIPFHPGRLLPRGVQKGQVFNAVDFIENEKHEPKKTNSETSQLSDSTEASAKPSVASSDSGHLPA